MCNEQENLPIDDKKNDAYNNDVGIDVDLAKTQEDICTESDRLKNDKRKVEMENQYSGKFHLIGRSFLLAILGIQRSIKIGSQN